MNDKTHLTGLTKAELVRFAEALGEPAYRGRQLFGALQRRRLRTFDEMTDLPKPFRERLSEEALAETLTVESRVPRLGRTSFAMEHRMTAPASRLAPARLIVVAESVLVTYDYAAARPIPLPDWLVEGIERLEGLALRG